LVGDGRPNARADANRHRRKLPLMEAKASNDI
jgi:hypothetical protein